jgi:hypothetical protein
MLPPGGSGVAAVMPASPSAAELATARCPPRRATTGWLGLAASTSVRVGRRPSARFDSCQAIEVCTHWPAAAAAAARPTAAANSATLRACSTGTSPRFLAASNRCSCASANAGSTVRAGSSTTLVVASTRSSRPCGSAETATTCAPRTATARYTSPASE